MSERRPARRLARSLVLLALLAPAAQGADRPLDPTRPPALATTTKTAAPDDASARLELHAVLFAEGRRVAIINERRVRESDRVAGARVVEIRPRSVRLRREGEDFELELIEQDVKRASGSIAAEDWGATTDPGVDDPTPMRGDAPPPPAVADDAEGIEP